MSSNVLTDRDINAPAAQQNADAKADVKSMEYHRQVLQNKLEEKTSNPMCLLGQHHEPLHSQAECLPKQAGWKGKAKVLFAKTSTKNLGLAPGSMFGEKPANTEDQKMGGR